MRNYIVIVEGVTDSGVVEAILEKGLHFKPYQNTSQLNDLLKQMIGNYPTQTGELKRTNSPMFYTKDDINVAIKLSNGCTNIPKDIANLLELILINEDEFNGFLIITDTDKKSRESLMHEYKLSLKDKDIELSENVIIYDNNKYICDFLFVPSYEQGAIEKILLQCSQMLYSDIYSISQDVVNRMNASVYEKYRKDWASDKTIQSFYMDKMQFGVISSVLKPDKPNRITIKDKIITTQNFSVLLGIKEFKYIYDFLDKKLQ